MTTQHFEILQFLADARLTTSSQIARLFLLNPPLTARKSAELILLLNSSKRQVSFTTNLVKLVAGRKAVLPTSGVSPTKAGKN